MDDLKALREVVLERIGTLAEVRLQKVAWSIASELSVQDLLTAAYVDGARDAMDYLGMLLEGGDSRPGQLHGHSETGRWRMAHPPSHLQPGDAHAGAGRG